MTDHNEHDGGGGDDDDHMGPRGGTRHDLSHGATTTSSRLGAPAGLPDRRVDRRVEGTEVDGEGPPSSGPFMMSTYAATTPVFGPSSRSAVGPGVAPEGCRGRVLPSRRPPPSRPPGALEASHPHPSAPPSSPVAVDRQRPTVLFIGPVANRRTAREWALVLQSQGIAVTTRPSWSLDADPQAPLSSTRLDAEPYRRDPATPRASGMMLEVRADDYPRALRSIELYERENENWPPPPERDPYRLHPASALLPLVFLAAALFFVAVTGPVAGGSAWFSLGRADASRLATEPWRMITALTLHADGSHIVGNAVSGSIFGTMLSRRIGPGAALLGFVLAGALGNALNAFHHLASGHLSIGASTAVFGAIGILAGIETMLVVARRQRRAQSGTQDAEVIARRRRYLDVVAPIVGGLTLLGTLGAGGGNTDVWAHGYGFLAGAGLGLATGVWLRRNPARPPSPARQLLASSVAVGMIVGAWALALG
ncbi:MAG: rhomboid family intramembrane serine protease [Myxococcota bacterium]